MGSKTRTKVLSIKMADSPIGQRESPSLNLGVLQDSNSDLGSFRQYEMNKFSATSPDFEIE
jgi:hypothetical protein